MEIIRSNYGANFKQEYDPPYGVGPNHKLWVNCEPFLDISKFDELHKETTYAFACMSQDHMHWAKFGGTMLPTEKGTVPIENEILVNEDELTDYDKEVISKMDTQQKRKYLYFTRAVLKPWAFTVYLRKGKFANKTFQHFNDWEPVADYFPKLKEFVGSLPFATIGRVMFFCTDGFRDVPIHRDDLPDTHYDHNINFFFDAGRKTFIYDSNTEEKTYIDPDCRAYFFNNRDFHGVDMETRFRYTLRVDGTFSNSVFETIGLYPDGAVMKNPK